MKIWSFVLGIILALASVGSAADLLIEHESRSTADKDNIWYRTDRLEVYVLRTANLELEAGPIHRLGPFKFTTKFGGVWNMADNTPHALLSENIVMKFGRLTCVSVNEFSLKGTFKKPRIDWAYNEGFVVVGLDGLLSNCVAGVFYEHYRKGGTEEVWVVGPRFDWNIPNKYLRKISFWSGVTDNPTAGIFFYFGTKL